MTYFEWAARWPQAAAELQAMIAPEPAPGIPKGADEAYMQAVVRLEASRAGARLWRNNIGAGTLDNGSYVRWGLANDSKAVNETLKSADLIGIYPLKIEPHHIGQVIGQFLSIEVKHPQWRFTGTKREQAQLNWANLILSFGGRAAIVKGPGSF